MLTTDGFVGVLRLSFASVVLACLTFGSALAQSTRPAIASNALPTGAAVNTGSASISVNGAQMAITQTSDKASLNWQSFNVGTGAAVNIAQPSASSVLLNRVVGNNPSQILGKLSANGQVILLNPNGILFGKDGSVTASAFTASTFGLSDADFMNGFFKFNRNGSTAIVVNQGTIETMPGGYVALIGASVSNEGTIRARQGHVVLAAAESATFQNNVGAPSTNASVSVPLSPKVRLELTPAALNAAVSNTGVITTEGGQVLISAAALSDAVAQIGARVTHSGVIDTSAAQGGAVSLLADNGSIKVDGSITANSIGPANDKPKAGGNIIIGRNSVTGMLAKSTDASGATLESQDGFVETSGDYLKTDGIHVKANEWLLDPTNINIVAAGASGTAYAANYTAGTDSNILASDINASLNAGTSVTIATSAAGASAGTITVAADISKTAGTNASLALTAHGNISLNANISTAFANGNVTLQAAGSVSGSGAIAVGQTGSTGASITINTATSGTLTGLISGTGNLTKTGAGTLSLTGNNTYGGTTTLNAGTLKVGSSSAFGSNPALSITSGTLDLAGYSISIGSLGGAGTVTNSAVTASRSP